MSSHPQTVVLNLTDEEQAAVQALQQEMGLDDPAEVMQMLLRQASQRAKVVCPNCGHSASRTGADDATCAECMSVIHLSDGIWQVIELQ
ncbi:MAG: hypothetical protein R2844_20185 [Caldilineales bacterium]